MFCATCSADLAWNHLYTSYCVFHSLMFYVISCSFASGFRTDESVPGQGWW